MTPLETAEQIVSQWDINRAQPSLGCSPGEWRKLVVAIASAIQTESNAQLQRSRNNSIDSWLTDQVEWSRRTFGEGCRTMGIISHIKKELIEVQARPHDLEEWIDVVILALDGYWRHGGDPFDLMLHLRQKQAKNFARKWPQILPEDQPTEHIKE